MLPLGDCGWSCSQVRDCVCVCVVPWLLSESRNAGCICGKCMNAANQCISSVPDDFSQCFDWYAVFTVVFFCITMPFTALGQTVYNTYTVT